MQAASLVSKSGRGSRSTVLQDLEAWPEMPSPEQLVFNKYRVAEMNQDHLISAEASVQCFAKHVDQHICSGPFEQTMSLPIFTHDCDSITACDENVQRRGSWQSPDREGFATLAVHDETLRSSAADCRESIEDSARAPLLKNGIKFPSSTRLPHSVYVVVLALL